MEEDVGWKQISMADNLGWKTIFDERLPSMKGDLKWKTTFEEMSSLLQDLNEHEYNLKIEQILENKDTSKLKNQLLHRMTIETCLFNYLAF